MKEGFNSPLKNTLISIYWFHVPLLGLFSLINVILSEWSIPSSWSTHHEPRLFVGILSSRVVVIYPTYWSFAEIKENVFTAARSLFSLLLQFPRKIRAYWPVSVRWLLGAPKREGPLYSMWGKEVVGMYLKQSENQHLSNSTIDSWSTSWFITIATADDVGTLRLLTTEGPHIYSTWFLLIPSLVYLTKEG